jgi:hypothetical protein
MINNKSQSMIQQCELLRNAIRDQVTKIILKALGLIPVEGSVGRYQSFVPRVRYLYAGIAILPSVQFLSLFVRVDVHRHTSTCVDVRNKITP